jgi:hypothetical protein
MFRFESGLYKDELFYSFVGRNLSSEPQDVVYAILKNMKIKYRAPYIQFSSYLKRYSELIPESFKYSSAYIIQSSTRYPLYAPFLLSARKKSVIEKITGDNPNGLYELLGMPGGHLFNNKKSLRYCPLCVVEDIKNHGEAYFHWVHHIDGLIVCPDHGCNIKKYANIDKLPLFNRFYLLEPANIDLNPCQLEDKDTQTRLIHIANQASLLLNINFNKFDIDSVSERYYAHLKEREFITNIAHVRIKELCHQFKQYYGENLLSTIKSDFDSDDRKNWIRSFFGYKNILLHPIRHVLLINFLCDGVKTFFDGHIYLFLWVCLLTSRTGY